MTTHTELTPPAAASGPGAPAKVPPWDQHPHRAQDRTLLSVELGDIEVLRYVDGSGSPGFDSPRPHLHPLRTRSGVVVTDDAPRDHTWHGGLGVGVQDVAGTNIWGGRTYLPDGGYRWRKDHGRIVHRTWLHRMPGTVRHRLAWQDPQGGDLLDEVRDLAWEPLDRTAWRMHLDVRLTRAAGGPAVVRLGSPGSHGRPAGGYGGVFLRLAPCTDVEVRTPTGSGEDAVHGSRPADGAHWLAWSARAADGSGEFTVAVAPGDDRTARDPWFVRVASYPGLGSALAWDRPLEVLEGSEVRRTFTWVIADGRPGDDAIEAALTWPAVGKDAP